MTRYAIVVEKGADSYGAYVPDLPGCVTTGRTVEEIKANIREAIELHLEGLAEDGAPVPEPTSSHDASARTASQSTNSFATSRLQRPMYASYLGPLAQTFAGTIALS